MYPEDHIRYPSLIFCVWHIATFLGCIYWLVKIYYENKNGTNVKKAVVKIIGISERMEYD